MKILVAGAGGFIGSHLVRALRFDRHEVLCCGRDEPHLHRLHPDCPVIEADFASMLKVEPWRKHLRGVDVVVNAAGIIQERGKGTFAAVHRDGPVALFQAAHEEGVRRIIQISALGADEGSATAYHQTKKAADDFLSTLPVEWVILRPSLVYGSGARSLEFFSALAALPIMPLVGSGEQRIHPVSVVDLTAAVTRLVQVDAPSRLFLDVVGPESLTVRQYFDGLRKWLGFGPARRLSIPVGLVRLVGAVGSVFKWEFVNVSTISMLCRENVGNPGPLARILGAPPHSFGEMFRHMPSRTADRWHAALYFLAPLLRVSIALVWIAAGWLPLAVYPREESHALLTKAGVPDRMASEVLVGTALLDVGLGLAALFKWKLPCVLTVQLFLIVAFSMITALWLPEFWLHPFGPLMKNGPLFVGTLILLALEGKA